MQNQHKLADRHSKNIAGSMHLATVLYAHAGEATEAILPGADKAYTVIAHGAEVGYLKEQDQVLVLIVNEGVIITHRLRRPGELPQQGFVVREDGILEIDNPNGVMIKSNNAHIGIDKTGRIFVDGKEIYSIADGLHRLQGTTIELN